MGSGIFHPFPRPCGGVRRSEPTFSKVGSLSIKPLQVPQGRPNPSNGNSGWRRRTDTNWESSQRQRRASYQPGSQRALRAKAQEHLSLPFPRQSRSDFPKVAMDLSPWNPANPDPRVASRRLNPAFPLARFRLCFPTVPAQSPKPAFSLSAFFIRPTTVLTTFITHHFNRGPWTNAVQGPKLFKIFISGFPKAAYK